MSYPSHYENLKVSRSASQSDVEAAYRSILLANSPEKMQRLGPFSRNLAKRQFRLPNDAWGVLSNPIKRWVYNKELDSFSEQQESWRQRSAGICPLKPQTTPRGMNEPPDSSSESNTYSPSWDTDKEYGEAKEEEEEEADDPYCTPESLRAAYRYGSTPVATDVDVDISSWRLRLRISSKFRFLNDLTELSDSRHGSQTLSFEIGLQRARETHRNLESTIPELILDVENMPSNLRISGLQTLLRELTPGSCSLVVTMSAHHCASRNALWTFGFNFDRNYLVKGSLKRGTCMIFTVDEPTEHLQTG